MWWLVVVAALGYFVDIYDLLLFSIVRVQSLQSLGLSPEEITSKGVLLINCQMAGLLIGGVFWGVWGDRRGRLQVLFGSILLYSFANIANAYAQGIPMYAACRFLAGIGLAGELGAGVTLVVETLPQKMRGYGTAIIASVGIFGAVLGGFVADIFPWRTSFIIGGCLGLGLLILRFRVAESSLYANQKVTSDQRGKFLQLFTDKDLFRRYWRVIMVGMPLWFVVGILITFSPEFAAALGLEAVPKASYAVMTSYAGCAIGDLIAGLLSQRLRSRKKIMALFITTLGLAITWHMLSPIKTLEAFYWSCAALGFFSGYWALFVTMAAESFGTNMRATVATTAPNFVRGGVIPMSFCFRAMAEYVGLAYSALILGLAVVIFALFSLRGLAETYHKEMDFNEV